MSVCPWNIQTKWALTCAHFVAALPCSVPMTTQRVKFETSRAQPPRDRPRNDSIPTLGPFCECFAVACFACIASASYWLDRDDLVCGMELRTTRQHHARSILVFGRSSGTNNGGGWSLSNTCQRHAVDISGSSMRINIQRPTGWASIMSEQSSDVQCRSSQVISLRSSVCAAWEPVAAYTVWTQIQMHPMAATATAGADVGREEVGVLLLLRYADGYAHEGA